MQFRSECEGKTRSPWKNRGSMPRCVAVGPRHGGSHVGQCDKETEEEVEEMRVGEVCQRESAL